MGGGENMVNVGVTFRMGEGNEGMHTSRTAMAQEITDLRSTVQKQAAENKKLAADVEELKSIVQKLMVHE